MQHRKISVIGLGYVGLPVAVAFGKKSEVIGFDINESRIKELQNGIDRTGEVEEESLKKATIQFTSNAGDLRKADFHIVCVPTPVTHAHQPDLKPILSATHTIGRQLKKGDIVVYESTVYPGLTEEECVPILERESGLKVGQDFAVGYSPERINPGDRERKLENTIKIVSASDDKTLQIVTDTYGSVVKAGIYKAPSIKTAEAAKVIENTQRDINIALMNELALIFHRMDIDTQDVIQAAATKWNFIPFTPGLVGGHCIGVDPYYLTHKAQTLGYHPQVILAGRRINDNMGYQIAQETVKYILKHNASISNLTVIILGMTFKENVPDIRNSRVVDIIRALEEYGIQVQAHDPVADDDEIHEEFGVVNTPLEKMKPADAVILAVAHERYKREGWPMVQGLLKKQGGFVADVKGCLDRQKTPQGIYLWRL